MTTPKKRGTSGFNTQESDHLKDDQTPTKEEKISAMLEQAPGTGNPETHAKLSLLADPTPIPPQPTTETVALPKSNEVKITSLATTERADVEHFEDEIKAPVPPKRHPRNIPKFSSITK